MYCKNTVKKMYKSKRKILTEILKYKIVISIWQLINVWYPNVLKMCNLKVSNLYWEPSIYASYQVSVHLAKRFHRRRFFRNQPIRNKNCLWRPCLLMDRDEMSNRNGGLSSPLKLYLPWHRKLKIEPHEPH